jgi:hypothetical protein
MHFNVTQALCESFRPWPINTHLRGGLVALEFLDVQVLEDIYNIAANTNALVRT